MKIKYNSFQNRLEFDNDDFINIPTNKNSAIIHLDKSINDFYKEKIV